MQNDVIELHGSVDFPGKHRFIRRIQRDALPLAQPRTGKLLCPEQFAVRVEFPKPIGAFHEVGVALPVHRDGHPLGALQLGQSDP